MPEKWAAINANTTAIGDSSKGLIADVSGLKLGLSNLGKSVDSLSGTVTSKFEANATQLQTINTEISGIKATLDDCQVRGVDTTNSYGVSLSLVDPNSDDDDTTATHVKVNVDIDTLAAAVIAKHDVPAPIAANISVADISTSYVNSDDKQWNVQSVLADLDTRITSAVSGGLTNVVAGVGINVTEVFGNKQTISVKTSELVVSGSALTVTDNKIDICWSEL